MIIPVIMSGGSGTRLWPLSRKKYPKQFLSLAGSETMLQQTLQRLEGIEMHQPIIVCNEDHRFIVAEQLRQIGIERPSILLEPMGRNTAPAIAIAALQAIKSDPEAMLLVLAADHVIADRAAFQQTVDVAHSAAREGHLVTFGIVPDGPETGYGYIRYQADADNPYYPVAAFVEKPDQATAESYLQSGDYLWNSGMFMFQSERYLQELKTHRSDILQACEAAMTHQEHDHDFIRLDREIFSACPAESIDYAVMEKTEAAVVVPLDAGWNDIGSWSALWAIDQKDDQGNSYKGDVINVDTHNCLIHAEDRLVATVGVEDLVIIETKDAIMVADRNRSQDVKKIVDQLKEKDRSEAEYHRVVYRPWGCFDSVEEGERFKVKRITVKPGAKLSVQMHHHRAEHWVVVSGTARVTRGEDEMLLTENESIYIPVGEIHALENPGKIPLEIIEIQSGAYLGEDDIVRLQDNYGRD